MLKLLVMLVTFLGVGIVLLGLRQHRLELNAQSVQIYAQIRDREEKLLNQNVEMARRTNPWALADALKDNGMNVGGALQQRGTQVGHTPPAIETDLVAPVR